MSRLVIIAFTVSILCAVTVWVAPLYGQATSRYLLESGSPDGYLLEDGTGVLLLEEEVAVGLSPHGNLLGVGR